VLWAFPGRVHATRSPQGGRIRSARATSRKREIDVVDNNGVTLREWRSEEIGKGGDGGRDGVIFISTHAGQRAKYSPVFLASVDFTGKPVTTPLGSTMGLAGTLPTAGRRESTDAVAELEDGEQKPANVTWALARDESFIRGSSTPKLWLNKMTRSAQTVLATPFSPLVSLSLAALWRRDSRMHQVSFDRSPVSFG
jgi:hypothetical protein